MNFVLPLSIEQYLRESGFSASELIVLKKLLEDNLLTVREIAAKTGKSNGIIDTAVKKLMSRGIVGRENINEQPRYSVIDPKAIVAWAKKNLKEHTDMMERRHQSFAQFMQNLTVGKNHPEIEHFSGVNGLMKAYDKLLENRAELLTYFDPASLAADDPLAEFRVHYSRRRQVHGVFQRVIAPDSPASRRFRSRDPFEYRRTMLVPPQDFPMSFTKIIAGDIVACLDSGAMEASFIRFEKLAESERHAFDRLWAEQAERERERAGAPMPTEAQIESAIIPLRQCFSMNVLQKICIGFFVILLLFWTALFVTQTKTGFFTYLYTFAFGLIPLFSGIVAISVTKKLWGGFKTAIGKAIFFIGSGLFLWGCGSLIWAYYNFFLDISNPYPGMADAFFLPSMIFSILGVVYLSEAAGAKFGLKNTYAKIFVMLAPLFILCVSYYFLVTLARGGTLVTRGDGALKMMLDIAYPLGDFLELTIATLISGLSFKYMRGRYTVDIWAILLGLATLFLGDFIFSYTTTIGTFYNGDFGDLIYTLSSFFLGFGILGFCTEKCIVQPSSTILTAPSSPPRTSLY